MPFINLTVQYFLHKFQDKRYMEQEVDKIAPGFSGDVLGRNESWVSIWEQ